jgi:hypothetical protein
MKTGCPECEKLDDNTMCDLCELGMLQYTAETALQNYIDKVNKILKGKKDELPNSSAKQR